MSDNYNDGKVECALESLRLHSYYFPFGTKEIAYSSIKDVRRVQISTFRGQWRIWGTANFKYWAPLDTNRPKKTEGLVLDLGRKVQPFITPDDADTVEQLIRERAHLGPGSTESSPGPIV